MIIRALKKKKIECSGSHKNTHVPYLRNETSRKIKHTKVAEASDTRNKIGTTRRTELKGGEG